jgi:predicted RNase H-like HicB family nuclease
MTYYTYSIAIEKEDGQYYAYSEDLPGVYGLGDSIDAAKSSMLEGIRLYIEECKKDGKPIPTARTVYTETVSLNNGDCS